MMGIQLDEDDITQDIEADLLKELNELDQIYPDSPTSPTSSVQNIDIWHGNSSDVDSVFDFIIKECSDVDNESSEHTDDNHSFLRSIPGYDMFTASAEASSAPVLAVLEAVDSIKMIVGEDNAMDEDSAIQRQMNRDVSNAVDDSTYIDKIKENTSTGNEIIIKPELGDECQGITTVIRSAHSTDKNESNDPSFLMLIDDPSFSLSEKIQDDIETEAEEECKHLELILQKNIRQRKLNASKERYKIISQNKSVNCLQRAFKEYLRKKRSRHLFSVFKGFQSCCKIVEFLMKKWTMCTWFEHTIHTKHATVLQYCFRLHLQRRQKRRQLLTSKLCYLTNRMKMRNYLRFWAVFVATLKLQDNLMYEINNSAIRIQCVFRKYLEKCKLRRVEETHASMTMIQKNYRGYVARKTFIILKKKMIYVAMSQAAILIQKHYKGYITRRHWEEVVGYNFSYVDIEVDKILSDEAETILNEIMGTMREDILKPCNWIPSKPNKERAIKTGGKLYSEEDTSKRTENEFTESTFDAFSETCSLGPRSVKDNNQSPEQNNIHQNHITNQPLKSIQHDSATIIGTEELFKEWNFNDQRLLQVSHNYERIILFR